MKKCRFHSQVTAGHSAVRTGNVVWLLIEISSASKSLFIFDRTLFFLFMAGQSLQVPSKR
jgi:hypothetical protein